MTTLTVTVSNITGIIAIFSKVQLMRYIGTDTPPSIINILDYVTIDNGIDIVSSRNDVSDIFLSQTYNQYYFEDPTGTTSDWYISRYTNYDTTITSGWSTPIQGIDGVFNYDPLFSPEVAYTASDKLVINKLRLLVGDPTNLTRMHGEEALSSLHSDRRVFELADKGWPYSVMLFNTQYVTNTNPTVNGYKYLRFNTPLDTSVTTVSGVDVAIDIWYTSFRYSDKQLMDAYDTTTPPAPLTVANCTQDIYLMQTAYDILTSESWELAFEDGAEIADNRDTYNPSAGLSARDKLLARLKKQLDEAVKSKRFISVGGVRID